MSKRPDYAPDWSPEQCAAYKREYLAGEPVEMATLEHDEDCVHCSLLRRLQREAEDAEEEGVVE